MPVFTAIYPSTALELPDEQRQYADQLLSLMQCAIDDLAISVSAYQRAVEARENFEREHVDTIEAHREKTAKETAFAAVVAGNAGLVDPLTRPTWTGEEVRDHGKQVDIAVHRERIRLRHACKTYMYRAPFVHALSVLSAADRFVKCLSKLVETCPRVHPALDTLREKAPGLTLARNSSQHAEDRARWLGKWNKRIDVNVLEIENLDGDELRYTDENGDVACFSVSEVTAAGFAEVFQSVIDELPWAQGHSHLHPTFGPLP